MRLTTFATQSSSPIIIYFVFQLVKCVQCADYRTFDVGDGSTRPIAKQDSISSGLSLPEAQFASRTGSLDIRSRYWSKTKRDEYPEEQDDDPYYSSAPSVPNDGDEFAQGQSEYSADEQPNVTVDREDNEHTVTINMPRMERTGGRDHMIKKFVIQPVIQYVVQYDKRTQREPREEMSGTQYEEYEGVEGQDRMRSEHDGRVERLFNDVNANFDGYWGNDENGGGYQEPQTEVWHHATTQSGGTAWDGGNNGWSAINQNHQAPGLDSYVSWSYGANNDNNNNNNNNNNHGVSSSGTSRGDGSNGMSLSDAVQVSNAQQQQPPVMQNNMQMYGGASRQDESGGMGGNQMMEANLMGMMGGQGGSSAMTPSNSMNGMSNGGYMSNNHEGSSQNSEGMMQQGPAMGMPAAQMSMNYGPPPQPRPTYGPPGMIPGEPMGLSTPQVMMTMPTNPPMPMTMPTNPPMPMTMATNPPMPMTSAPQMQMTPAPQMQMTAAPAPQMMMQPGSQMSMSSVPQIQPMSMQQPQPVMQAPPQPPPVKEISYSVNFGLNNYGPPPPMQPQSSYGPPAPQPPPNYGPAPQPQPNYGPASQPQSSYGPPPQSPPNYGQPPQQSPPNYGPQVQQQQQQHNYGGPSTNVNVAPVATNNVQPQQSQPAPNSNAPETESATPANKPTQSDSAPSGEGGYGSDEPPKGSKGKKPGWGRPKRPRGGKSFMHSLRNLPKLPASIGGHLSFMFSTGFGKGKRGRGRPGGGVDGKNGSKTSIDKEQVSDHILNILGLTVNQARGHSLNISQNSTNPISMWEQLGNQSSLDHLSHLPITLVQGGTPEDISTTTHHPDKVASGSSVVAVIPKNQTDVVIMEPEIIVHNDSIVTTATVKNVTQTNYQSLNEAERQVRITLSSTTPTSTTPLPPMTILSQPQPKILIATTTPSPLMTTTSSPLSLQKLQANPSILPPFTSTKSPLVRVNTSVPLPLMITKLQTLYPLPPAPSKFRQGRNRRPPTPSPQTQFFPLRNTSPPPPHFTTPYDPVQEYINYNLSNNILHLEDPYVPPKNSSITKANILAYYSEPNLGDPIKIKFDPLIYDALQAAFQHDNTYYYPDNYPNYYGGITKKRKRSRHYVPSYIDVRTRSNYNSTSKSEDKKQSEKL